MIEHLITGVYSSYIGIACFVIPSAIHARFKMQGDSKYREAKVIPLGIATVWISGVVVIMARLTSDLTAGLFELIGAAGIVLGGVFLTHGLGFVIAGNSTTWIAAAVSALLFVAGTAASVFGVV